MNGIPTRLTSTTGPSRLKSFLLVFSTVKLWIAAFVPISPALLFICCTMKAPRKVRAWKRRCTELHLLKPWATGCGHFCTDHFRVNFLAIKVHATVPPFVRVMKNPAKLLKVNARGPIHAKAPWTGHFDVLHIHLHYTPLHRLWASVLGLVYRLVRTGYVYLINFATSSEWLSLRCTGALV